MQGLLQTNETLVIIQHFICVTCACFGTTMEKQHNPGLKIRFGLVHVFFWNSPPPIFFLNIWQSEWLLPIANVLPDWCCSKCDLICTHLVSIKCQTFCEAAGKTKTRASQPITWLACLAKPQLASATIATDSGEQRGLAASDWRLGKPFWATPSTEWTCGAASNFYHLVTIAHCLKKLLSCTLHSSCLWHL